MYKLTAIVPVYNDEDNIKRRLDSILEQNIYENRLEIVIVNDGSTDKSEEIIKPYLDAHPTQIRYYYKEHSGMADTRNFGISKSNAEFFHFVDNDGYLDKNAYEDVLCTMNGRFDIVKFNGILLTEKGRKIDEIIGPTFEYKTGEKAYEDLYRHVKYMDQVWLYFFNRIFWEDNKLEFLSGAEYSDFGTTSLAILKAPMVTSLDICAYNYIVKKKKISFEKITKEEEEVRYKKANDLLLQYDKMIKALDRYLVSDRSKDNIKMHYANKIFLEIRRLKTKEDKNKYIEEIKKRDLVKRIKVRDSIEAVKRLLLNINIKWYVNI